MTGSRQPDLPITQNELVEVLQAALPHRLREQAGDLAAAIIAAIRNESAVSVSTASLAAALEALGGKHISLNESVVSFGSGNQLGDVSIGDVAGRDLIRITLVLGDADEDGEERSYRRRTLEVMQRFWIDGVLLKSLHFQAFIDLPMRYDDAAVHFPFHVVTTHTRRVEPINSDRDIRDVFDQEERQILVLGEPGSGKTTLLLHLARSLVQDAQAQAAAPVPIVFQLSSWRKRRPLLDWMLDQLAETYDVPVAIGRRWFEQRRVIPLLDGLDELSAGHRPACVQAINQFRRTLGTPGLVVACRREEYSLIGKELQLRAAIRIEPMSFSQVDSYLALGGASLDPLRATIAQNRELQKMAETPLLLNLLILILGSATTADIERVTKHPSGRAHLYERYVELMFDQYQLPDAIPQSTMRSHLIWLALQIRLDGSLLINRRRMMLLDVRNPIVGSPFRVWEKDTQRSIPIWEDLLRLLLMVNGPLGWGVAALFYSYFLTPAGQYLIDVLEHGCRLNLLRRVNDGYMFIHRELMEHFADSAPPEMRQSIIERVVTNEGVRRLTNFFKR